MSTATAAGAGKFRQHHPPGGAERLALTVAIAVVVVDVAILLVGAVVSRGTFLDAGWGLVAWVAAVAIVGIASLPFNSDHQLGLDMPVLLSIGYLFGGIVAGLVAFVAYVDPREFRGEISLPRALFNRAQTSLSVLAGAAAYHLVAGDTWGWPWLVVAALLAVGADTLVNFGMVVAVVALHERIGLSQALARLRFGSISEFALIYISFGLLSLLLAEIYLSVGPWGLAAFAIPVVLARQAFSTSRRLEVASRRVQSQLDMLKAVSSTIAKERREERLSLASGLHDEVLPPLFKVHLLGQVLRHDLAAGRLLELEVDVPELLSATEDASESMRALIDKLRKSPIGSGGLGQTLRLLAQHLERETNAHIETSIEDVDATPLIQLLAYQVAREALYNALRHSQASRIGVVLCGDASFIRVVIEDDGVGFVPGGVDASRHFGLALMRERVELTGGLFQLETERGAGTRVVVRLPTGRLTD